MKIALDISMLYIAGAGVFYHRYNLIRAMLALPSDHEFVLLDFFPIPGGWVRQNPPEVAILLSSGVNVQQVEGLKHRKLAHVGPFQGRWLSSLAAGLDRILDGTWGKLCSAEVDRRVRRQLAGADLFHSSEVLQVALPGAANVITIHDLTALLFPEYHTPQVRELQGQKLRFAQTEADVVIAVSESTKQDLVEHLGLDPARVHVVHNGADPSFRPLPPEVVASTLSPLGLALQQGSGRALQDYILNVGTIEPRKNLVRLIEAYHRLRKESPRPVPKLVLAGAQGWLYDEVFEQIAALDLEGAVVYLGRVESEVLPALYNGARLFVYPSLYEGFGLPVLEAMACGVPTITSNRSSLPEVAGDAALLVDPQDVAQIAEAMGNLLENEGGREHLREQGFSQAARFTWERAAKETFAVYEGSIDSRRATR
ncbi:glycosyltransferase family 4 protein [Chloroflexota bacterium]